VKSGSNESNIDVKLGSTYPLDLVRSRLSIATASVSMSILPATTVAKQATAPALTPLQQPARHALASAYHTSSSAPILSSVYTKADLTIWGMTKKIMREEGGVRALYRGMLTTAVGVAPYVGINFAAYEFFRGVITPPGKSSVWRKLSCGALAGETHSSTDE
jgi:solute carrier family 25 phosphate transporter 23/24/25/41